MPPRRPTWCPRRRNSHPKAPKMRQEPPRTAQQLPQRRTGSDRQAPWGENTPQSSSRLPPDLDFGTFWRLFGTFLGYSRNSPRRCSGGCAPPDPPAQRSARWRESRVAAALEILLSQNCKNLSVRLKESKKCNFLPLEVRSWGQFLHPRDPGGILLHPRGPQVC